MKQWMIFSFTEKGSEWNKTLLDWRISLGIPARDIPYHAMQKNTVWRNFQQIGKMRSEKAGVRRYTCLSGRQGLRSERLLLL